MKPKWQKLASLRKYAHSSFGSLLQSLLPKDTLLRTYSFCGSFVIFMSCVCHAFASVHRCLVVTCWERADLLALACDV